MTRPATHGKHPGTCSFCDFAIAHAATGQHLLCFHGDTIDEYDDEILVVNQVDIGDLHAHEQDEFDRFWAGRVVSHEDTCDQFENDEERE